MSDFKSKANFKVMVVFNGAIRREWSVCPRHVGEISMEEAMVTFGGDSKVEIEKLPANKLDNNCDLC